MATIRIFIGMLIVLVTGTSLAADAPWTQQRFDKDIAAIFVSKCLDCHSGAAAKGKLDLSNHSAASKGGESGSAVVGKSLAKSLIWQRIAANEMPPKQKLSAAEKSLIKSWIEAGAAWGTDPIDAFRITTDKRAGYDWWSLQPIVKPNLPKLTAPQATKNGVDAFVFRQLEQAKLTPSHSATAQALLRRLTFDLTGLPPSPEDIQEFSKKFSKDRDLAVEHAVERLLKSQHYGERWARHWLDVARFGESQGFERDKLRTTSWHYRDWVINALNNDMPYDEFARLQIAGDVLRPNDPDAITATGFLVAGAYDEVGNAQSSLAMRAIVRQDELEDLVGTIGQTYLGLTVNCARCHDHKFDPIRQKEYYQLTSTMGGVRHGERDVMPKKNSEKQRELSAYITELRTDISKLEQVARNRLAARVKDKSLKVAARVTPLARWTFDANLNDQVGVAHATQHTKAKIDKGYLVLNRAAGYGATHPVKNVTLKAKTLEVWVKLDNLEQRGGATISVQDPNGAVFDAIVFGEREPGRWMAGSNVFKRTQSFKGSAETAAESVHIAIAYHEDGTIAAFRNGKPYGKPYQSGGLVTYAAGKWMVLFGLRHGAPSADRQLQGLLDCAQLYDRALTPKEVHTSYISEASHAVVVAELSAVEKAHRDKLVQEIARLLQQQAQFKPHRVYSVTPRAPETAYLLDRGNPAAKGEAVAGGGVAAVVGPDANFGLQPNSPDADRRKKLAEWVTDKRNPLFARVMVNRVWHHHFGAGLVTTPNDFGFNGGQASHPELLDWLAAEFVASGYSIKHLHRLILNSATYRQASKHRSDCVSVDASNRLLWRFSPQRLSAEAVRDSVLAVAGQLNRQYGGAPYQDFKTFTRNTQFYTMTDPIGAAFNRRTIYRTWIRSGRSLFLDVFDCPDPSTTAPKRAVTITPSQSLSLLNNSFVLRMSKHFAERAVKDEGDDSAAQIRRVIELAYSRKAQAEEVDLASEFVKTHGLSAFCRVVFNTNEFLYID